jgi:hypothetical protein
MRRLRGIWLLLLVVTRFAAAASPSVSGTGTGSSAGCTPIPTESSPSSTKPAQQGETANIQDLQSFTTTHSCTGEISGATVTFSGVSPSGAGAYLYATNGESSGPASYSYVPVIVSVSVPENSASAVLTIYGTAFSPGASVYVTNMGVNANSAAIVTVATASSALIVPFDLTAGGTYSIQVVNPDGRSSDPYSFAIWIPQEGRVPIVVPIAYSPNWLVELSATDDPSMLAIRYTRRGRFAVESTSSLLEPTPPYEVHLHLRVGQDETQEVVLDSFGHNLPKIVSVNAPGIADSDDSPQKLLFQLSLAFEGTVQIVLTPRRTAHHAADLGALVNAPLRI